MWHFSYGANMNYYTLAQRGVRVLSRDAAHIVDKNTRMVFTHRGGENLPQPASAGSKECRTASMHVTTDAQCCSANTLQYTTGMAF